MKGNLVGILAMTILSGCASSDLNKTPQPCSSIGCTEGNAPAIAPDGAGLSFQTCQEGVQTSYEYRKVEGNWVLRAYDTRLTEECAVPG
ncbi:hypothetical protein GCM10027359_31640 [Marilutibacter aestuarii]|uniref:Lipoprotein n=1 Tax=Marilutibacter aestuarii TaxID=1706195 RepID=A0A507ZN89_9GAMM|nr:hypothetical protein FKV25_15675 [Lysobacter aestuarii]